MKENAAAPGKDAARLVRDGVAVTACTLSLLAGSHVRAETPQILQKQPDGVILSFGHDALRLQALAPGVIRVRYSADKAFPPQRVPVLLPGGAPPAFRVREDADSVTLLTERLRARVDRRTGAVRFLDASGRRVLEEASGSRSLTPVILPAAIPGDQVSAYRAADTFTLAPGEAIYGLGQHQDGHLDHRGTTVIEEQANREVAIPFLVSNLGYGLLWNDAAHTEVAVGSQNGTPGEQSAVDWTSEAADTIDYTVFYGPSLDRVMAEYRHATGEAPLIPKWALGLWQSKEHYATQQEWLDIAQGYRSRHEPLDNIVQDWFYWDPHPWGSHEFDAKRYPDPAAAIKTLHDQDHLHFMISVWGKFDPDKPNDPDANYDELNTKGFLYPTSVRGPDQFYDAFSPDARAIYWRQIRDALFSKGVDAWWMDASEPEVNMTEFRKTKTAAGLGAQVLNAWPLMHATGVSEGQRRDAPDKRVFILTRSAYAGQQRTGAATWSGDITAGWDVFARQIPAGLNFCLSGIPYWTTDIGGFFVPRRSYPGGSSNPAYRELFTRWFEYGAFCPLFRVHGTDTPKELWRFGPDTEKTLVKYDTLRYRLMPYLYSLAWQVTHGGGTIMQALVMDFPNDRVARESADEFLFGPSLLVCPVTQPGVVSRSVYLPAGTGWTDFWTGAHSHGGRTVTADAPIEKIPLFIRDGAIIPFGPELQYVDEKAADPIELRVYTGADGAFTLYEDEGDNTNYLRGRYATIPFSWHEKTRTLTLGRRTGSFAGMLKARTFRIIWERPRSASPPATKTVTYTGKALTVHG